MTRAKRPADPPPPPEPAPRKRTMAEMAADARSASGIRCPKCWCEDSRVKVTWDAVGVRRRKRVCRHCGYEFATTER